MNNPYNQKLSSCFAGTNTKDENTAFMDYLSFKYFHIMDWDSSIWIGEGTVIQLTELIYIGLCLSF